MLLLLVPPVSFEDHLTSYRGSRPLLTPLLTPVRWIAPSAGSVSAAAPSGLIVGSIFFDLDLEDVNAKLGVSLQTRFSSSFAVVSNPFPLVGSDSPCSLCKVRKGFVFDLTRLNKLQASLVIMSDRRPSVSTSVPLIFRSLRAGTLAPLPQRSGKSACRHTRGCTCSPFLVTDSFQGSRFWIPGSSLASSISPPFFWPPTQSFTCSCAFPRPAPAVCVTLTRRFCNCSSCSSQCCTSP